MTRTLLSIAGGIAAVLLVSQASAQDLRLHYNFDEGAGTVAADSVAPPADGTLVGAGWTANTPAGFSPAAVDLSAANTYVTTPSPAKIDGLGQFTLTAWVNLQGTPAHGNRVMSKQDVTSFDGFSFAFNNPTSGSIAANHFQLNLALGGVGGFAFNTSGADLDADNRWVFVAVTYDGTQSSDNLRFWSGDELAGVAQLGPTRDVNVGAMVANPHDFRVGAQSQGTISAPVWIDDVRVYGSVLSGDQLEQVRMANIPEPASLSLLGLAGLGLIRRRRM